MTQYIDKSAVVAEINNWIKNARRRYTMSVVQFSLSDRIKSLENLLSFLDTLEVKEVDLEKEFNKCCEDYIFDDEWDVYIARHFFKLGFQKAQKGE